jgi:hypothetical protein
MAIIPDKPASLSDGEWDYVLARDNHQCALVEQCRAAGRLGQTDYCSQRLHVDHEQPRALGGDDSWMNQRLLCESKNCGRPVEPADHWARLNFWDHPIADEKLRQIQRLAGYEAVLDPEVSPALTEHRNALLQRITLLPGATGIGKAMLMLSVLFAINRVVNEYGSGRPRVSRVLWLATDTTLRDAAVIELTQDAYTLGVITHREPSVAAFDSYNDFQSGPGGHEIVVSCPHILWKVETDAGMRRSEYEVRKALKWFDTIVFDEGDWAHSQVRRLALIASHALKFALTASPPIISTNDADHFHQ